VDTVSATLAGLRDELIARGGAYAEALARGRAVRVSLNQTMSGRVRPSGGWGRGGFLSAGDRGLIMGERVSIQFEDFDLSAEVERLRGNEKAWVLSVPLWERCGTATTARVSAAWSWSTTRA
jgi:hypothetical protein